MGVQIPPSGTHGAFFPRLPAWLAQRLSRMAANRYRRKGGTSMRGVPGVILETTGAKSGLPRQTVVGHVIDGPDAWLVIASAGGAAQHPNAALQSGQEP